MSSTDEKIDVFIPAAIKDTNKLSYTIESLVKHFHQLNDIHISMPDKLSISDSVVANHNIFMHNDFDVLPDIDLKKCRFRPNWIFQQLLKLCQNVTSSRRVLVFDADCILIKDLNAFGIDSKMKLFCRSNTQDESAYLRYMSIVSKNDLCEMPTSDFAETHFIADMQLFDYDIVNDMINRYFSSKQQFIDVTLESTFWEGNHMTGVFISEYEMYGRYVQKYFGDQVAVQELVQNSITKFQNSQNCMAFTEDEMQSAIQQAAMRDCDVLKLQSSCCASDVSYLKKGKQ